MNPPTSKWIEKAEEDFAAAVVLSRRRKPVMPGVVCFHCQQCAEKYLKGRLCEAGIEFPKTHNLNSLLDLVLPVEPLWESLRPALLRLGVYAVWYRYPGQQATLTEAKEVLELCRIIRSHARQSLGLDKPPQPPLRVREKPARYRVKRQKK